MNLEEKIENLELSEQLKKKLIKNKIYNLNDLVGFLSAVDLTEKGVSTRFGLKRTLIEELLDFKNNVITKEMFSSPITLDSSVHFSPKYLRLTRFWREFDGNERSVTFKDIIELCKKNQSSMYARWLSIIPNSVSISTDETTVETSILESDLTWDQKSELLLQGYSSFYEIINLDEIDVAKSARHMQEIIIQIKQRFKHEQILYLNKPVSDLRYLGIDTTNLEAFLTLEDLLCMSKNTYINAKQKSAIEKLFHSAGYKFAYEIEKDLPQGEQITLEEATEKKKFVSAEMKAVQKRSNQKEELIREYKLLLEEYVNLVEKESELDICLENLFYQAQKLLTKK